MPTQTRKRSLVARVLVGTGVALASGFLLYKYARHKMDEAERERASKRHAKQNIKVRFEQLQKDCFASVSRLLPLASSQLFPIANVESVTTQLQNLRGTKENSNEDAKRVKKELWEDLKIASFTRTLSAIYILNFINILSHVQLNIMGRFTYLASVSPSLEPLSSETQMHFLNFSYFIVHEGMYVYVARVKAAVESVFFGVSVSSELSSEDLAQKIAYIRESVESFVNSTNESGLGEFLLPKVGTEDEMLAQAHGVTLSTAFASNSILRSLVAELRDFVDSLDFGEVMKACLDKSFSLFEAHLKANLFPAEVDAPEPEKITEITSGEVEPKRVKLASTLPAVSRFAGELLAGEQCRTLTVEFHL
ncbi:Peroxin-3 [Chytriomyces sp. MP71]|nr:Peroxin-3 [Chytriomyces sp. MP71]